MPEEIPSCKGTEDKTTLEELIQLTVRKIQSLDIIHDFGKVAVALSGGIDSVTLLALTVKALGQERVTAIHIDHQVREESKEDARWCIEYAKSQGVSCHVAEITIPDYNFQAEARTRRYATIRRIMFEQACQTLLTAHHANDRIETGIERLTRGANSSGITSLRLYTTLRETPICRPLLGLEKEKIIKIALHLKLSWREDSSNYSIKYRRNDLRQNAIPTLIKEHGIAPLLRSLDHLEEEAQLIDEAIEPILKTAIVPYFDRNAIRIDRFWIERLSSEMKRRIIYTILQSLRIYPSSAHIAHLTELHVNPGECKIIEVPGGEITLSSRYYTIELDPISPKKTYPMEIALPEKESSYQWFEYNIQIKRLQESETFGEEKGRTIVWLKEKGKIEVDGPRPGARFPFNSKTFRVSERLRERQIATEDRWRHPVLYLLPEAGEEITLGIPGDRLTTKRYGEVPYQITL